MVYTIKKSKIEVWGYEINARYFHDIASSVDSAIRYLQVRFGPYVKYRVIEDKSKEENIMTNYEVYENNGGMLYLCILDANGQCTHIYEHWEYGPEGILADALEQLREDSSVHYDWYDYDLVERLTSEDMDTSAQQLYSDGLGDLIADSTGYVNSHMGCAGRLALNFNG